MALSNSQYKSIIRDYEHTRDVNRARSAARREKVYSAIPGFRELAESVSGLSVASARRMLDGDEHALEELHQELASISNRQKQLLKEHGFPPDHLEPLYTCSDCQDTGYLKIGRAHV